MSKKFKLTSSLFSVALSLSVAHLALAQTIVNQGVLGNSGEQGKTLVRFNPSGASGLGVAVDRFGSIWDRGGLGTLNRYSIDGRLIAQYKIPNGFGTWHTNEQIAVAGDKIVLMLGGALYTLPITATSDVAPTELKVGAGRMSPSSKDGKVAIYNNGELFWVDVNTGKTEKAGTIKDINWMDIGPDGNIYAVGGDWQAHKFVGGKEITTDGWPKPVPGERTQYLDGYWWGQSWAGTIRRFNQQMQADPGVVQGGSSGAFIGYLAQNSELSNGRGLGKVRNGLFAASGFTGIVQLLQWNEGRRQLDIVRRIGSVPFCQSLGLDRAGNIWWYAGGWRWDDTPDTPLRYGMPNPDGAGPSQVVMLPNDRMVAPGFLYNKPAFYYGGANTPLGWEHREQSALMRNGTGSAVYRNEQGELLLLVVNATGEAQTFKIGDDGRYYAEGGPVTLQLNTPAKELTTLAMNGESTLLAATDGSIVELARDGANWKETRRWSSWGNSEAQKFGSRIFIASDANRLWVSDRDNNRVLCFDLTNNKLLATFGGAKGDSFTALDAPEVIAARSDRAVVYDSGNQRLMKLVFKP